MTFPSYNKGFPIPGDLDLSEDGRNLLFVTGPEKVAQSIKVRAQIFRGSWRYDRNKGMPYFQDILAHGTTLELVRRRFFELVSETDGVESVTSIGVRFDREIGTIYVDFAAIADGETVTGTLDFVAS